MELLTLMVINMAMAAAGITARIMAGLPPLMIVMSSENAFGSPVGDGMFALEPSAIKDGLTAEIKRPRVMN